MHIAHAALLVLATAAVVAHAAEADKRKRKEPKGKSKLEERLETMTSAADLTPEDERDAHLVDIGLAGQTPLTASEHEGAVKKFAKDYFLSTVLGCYARQEIPGLDNMSPKKQVKAIVEELFSDLVGHGKTILKAIAGVDVLDINEMLTRGDTFEVHGVYRTFKFLILPDKEYEFYMLVTKPSQRTLKPRLFDDTGKQDSEVLEWEVVEVSPPLCELYMDEAQPDASAKKKMQRMQARKAKRKENKAKAETAKQRRQEAREERREARAEAKEERQEARAEAKEERQEARAEATDDEKKQEEAEKKEASDKKRRRSWFPWRRFEEEDASLVPHDAPLRGAAPARGSGIGDDYERVAHQHARVGGVIVPEPHHHPAAVERYLSEMRFAEVGADPPAAFDARDAWPECESFVVMDQGSCGSCWAFAAASAYSARLCVHSGGKANVVLAPQDLLSCVMEDGCAGGWPSDAFSYMEAADGGMVTDWCDPYSGLDQNDGDACGSTCAESIAYNTEPGTTAYGVGWTPLEAVGTVTHRNNLNTIKHAISRDGPVVAIMTVYPSFFDYTAGVYRPRQGEASAGSHAVKLLGWGTDASGQDYWLIQNSYGESWGEDGFGRIALGENACDLEYYGVQVTRPKTPPEFAALGHHCLNGGDLLVDGSCRCEPQFSGDRCEKCASTCKNHGTPATDGSCACSCPDGFWGPQCEHGAYVVQGMVCATSSFTVRAFGEDIVAGDFFGIHSDAFAAMYDGGAWRLAGWDYACPQGTAGTASACPDVVELTLEAPATAGEYVLGYGKHLGVNEFGHDRGYDVVYAQGLMRGALSVVDCGGALTTFPHTHYDHSTGATCPGTWTDARKTDTGDACEAAWSYQGHDFPAHMCSVNGFNGKEWCYVDASRSLWAACAPLRETVAGDGCVFPFTHDGATYTDCADLDGSGEAKCATTVKGGAAEDRAAVALGVCKPCSRSCRLSDWSNWSSCSAACGTGQRERTRHVVAPAIGDGVACTGETVEAEACNTQACPVPCKYSSWTPGSCSAACGGGTRTVTRTKTVQGNLNCDLPLSRVEPCNEQACPPPPPEPVDCVVSAWSSWSACSADCGTGQQVRTRTVQVQPQHGGNACPAALTEKRTCNTVACPVHCEVGAWSPYSACNRMCGGGSKYRTRAVQVQPQHGGNACPALSASAACNTQPCQQCVLTPWSAWGECSATCGGGTRARSRSIEVNATGDATPCSGPYTQHQPCNTQACPVDCKVSAWGPLSACSATCGGGTQVKTRTVVTPAAHGGKACPALRSESSCNTHPCPVDCKVSAWGDFSACSASCGGGTHKRTRSVVTPTAHGGKTCPTLVNEATCNTHACPVDCTVTAWGEWSKCSATCGGGKQRRERSVAMPAAHGGKACPALVEEQACNDDPCPVDCQMTAWSAWGECSATCEGGVQTRSRDVAVAAAHGGKACPATTASRTCNTHACPVDCAVSEWSAWGECSASCGGGKQHRERSVVTEAAHGGKACPAVAETRTCNDQECPVDCAVSEWSAWSGCSASCGGGKQQRTRSVETAARHGGKACPALVAEQACNEEACPVDCEVESWGEWGACSASCGGGVQTRGRGVAVAAAHGGKACPALEDSRVCNTAPCAVDCEVSGWGKWGACSATCGGGEQKRTREVTVAAAHGGKTCPALAETQTCNTEKCEVDCEMSAWSAWGACSASCGGGESVRVRTVKVEAAHGGKACGPVRETQKCNTQACPVNCEVSGWGEWSKCSEECGGGEQTRTRSVKVEAAHGGEACPDLVQSQKCNMEACKPQVVPVDCEVSDWSTWGACSASCGGGKRQRTRSVETAAAHGGKACGALVESEACNTQACPVDCELGGWGAWSQCSAECGGGKQTRARTVARFAAHGGKACEEASEERECNTQECGVNCKVSEWGAWGECNKRCGGGVRRRSRTIEQEPKADGLPCPETAEEEACNTQPCGNSLNFALHKLSQREGHGVATDDSQDLLSHAASLVAEVKEEEPEEAGEEEEEEEEEDDVQSGGVEDEDDVSEADEEEDEEEEEDAEEEHAMDAEAAAKGGKAVAAALQAWETRDEELESSLSTLKTAREQSVAARPPKVAAVRAGADAAWKAALPPLRAAKRAAAVEMRRGGASDEEVKAKQAELHRAKRDEAFAPVHEERAKWREASATYKVEMAEMRTERKAARAQWRSLRAEVLKGMADEEAAVRSKMAALREEHSARAEEVKAELATVRAQWKEAAAARKTARDELLAGLRASWKEGGKARGEEWRALLKQLKEAGASDEDLKVQRKSFFDKARAVHFSPLEEERKAWHEKVEANKAKVKSIAEKRSGLKENLLGRLSELQTTLKQKRADRKKKATEMTLG